MYLGQISALGLYPTRSRPYDMTVASVRPVSRIALPQRAGQEFVLLKGCMDPIIPPLLGKCYWLRICSDICAVESGVDYLESLLPKLELIRYGCCQPQCPSPTTSSLALPATWSLFSPSPPLSTTYYISALDLPYFPPCTGKYIRPISILHNHLEEK